MTYEYFKNNNNLSKQLGVKPVGKILAVQGDMCRLAVFDNESNIDIMRLVEDIVHNGLGCISNPSALQNWKGWER